MCCVQSPCEDMEWENSFCRAMAELLNYLIEEEKISSWGLKKVFMDQCENVLAKKIGFFFFPLAVEKKKKGLFHRVL